MKVIFFTHPDFLGHQSMPRFAKMLSDGMQDRGHDITMWSPVAKFSQLPAPAFLKKWMGYIDQFIVFPRRVKKLLKNTDQNTLFVFTDHALGPWVLLVADKPHVIHCHDFLAQRSASNEIEENPTSYTGKIYQKMIRNGYSKGKNFISVSQKTKEDLHRFLNKKPAISEVVYNGMNGSFTPQNVTEVRETLSKTTNIDLTAGYLLHVGGNQWYKNRVGIIEIYNALRSSYKTNLPLLLIGENPDVALVSTHETSAYKKDIHFLVGINDATVKKAYAGATLLLYPSYDEGFGWPIAEAMASGCPVITTNEPPMTEVAASAAFLIPKRTITNKNHWAADAAKKAHQLLSLTPNERATVVKNGLENVKRFDQKKTLDAIEKIYSSILANPVER
ncbi:glycosyltransferase [Aurantibacter sp.]|uniref:glycosyltransferase n=1 Tax=Aurantibacter sp. TaxID=2807103 RepID=UPI00326305FA